MSTSMSTSYGYNPLPSSRHIRLIELSSCSDHSAPLTGTIRIINIDDEDSLPYVALSYTWGQSALRENLLVDGSGVLRITLGLASALRRFRYASALRWIWADAVCINQHDNVEKSMQIPLMASIYRGASRVMVWLGDQPEDAEVLRSVRRNITQAKRSNVPGNTDDRATKANTSSSLSKLGLLPYFTRRWVIQELTVNQNVVLCCGQIELPWPQLVGHVDEAANDSGLRRIRLLWDSWWGVAMGQHNLDNSDGNDLLTSRSIARLMYSYSDAECLDGRDRIAALQGLATDATTFKVDYADSVERTYVKFAEHLAETGLLAWLMYQKMGSTKAYTQKDELPSWVPDWRSRVEAPLSDNVSYWKSISGYSIQASKNSQGSHLLTTKFIHLRTIVPHSGPAGHFPPSRPQIAHNDPGEPATISHAAAVSPALFEVAWKSVLFPEGADLGECIALALVDLGRSCKAEDWVELLVRIFFVICAYEPESHRHRLWLKANALREALSYPGIEVANVFEALKLCIQNWILKHWEGKRPADALPGSDFDRVAKPHVRGLVYCTKGGGRVFQMYSPSGFFGMSAVIHPKVEIGDKVLFADIGTLGVSKVDSKGKEDYRIASDSYIVREHSAPAGLESGQPASCSDLRGSKGNQKVACDGQRSLRPCNSFSYEFIAHANPFFISYTRFSGEKNLYDPGFPDFWAARDGQHAVKEYRLCRAGLLRKLERLYWGEGVELVNGPLSIWVR